MIESFSYITKPKIQEKKDSKKYPADQKPTSPKSTSKHLNSIIQTKGYLKGK